MTKKFLLYNFLIILCVIQTLLLDAQGFQTKFGKNKVQYKQFDWSFYRDKEFEVYYHQNGRNLAQYLLSHAHELLAEAEMVLDYKTDQRIIFVIYNTYADFKQSNLKLIEESYNSGGLTPVVDNIAFVYFDGNHLNFNKRIKSSITEVLLNEQMYGSSVQERFQNSALITLPDWYYKGLIAYVSNDWDLIKQEQLDRGIKSEHFKKFGHLTSYERILLGYSFWNYIDKAYGKSSISNILYITHVYKSIESGYNFVLGKSFNQLYREWYDYYSLELMDRKHNFDDYNEPNFLKKIKKQAEITQIKLSPDAKKIAYITNDRGKTRVWIYNRETNKYKRVITKGYIQPDAEMDKTYPLMDWHPRENILTVIYEKRAKIKYFDYNLDKKKRENKKKLDYIEKVLDFRYDYIGRRIVMSAIKNGYSDIIQFEMRSNRFFPVTNDLYDDLNPAFTKDSKGILFSSNRTRDTLDRKRIPAYAPIQKSFDIFYFNNKTQDDKLKRLTNTAAINETHPQIYDTMYYSYLIDENHIINRNAVRLDSSFQYSRIIVYYLDTARFSNDTFIFKTIDSRFMAIDPNKLKDTNIFFKDTSYIYKDITYIYSLTNYASNILLYSISEKSKKILEVFMKDQKYFYTISNFVPSIPDTVQTRTYNKVISNNYEVQRKDEPGFAHNSSTKPAKQSQGFVNYNTSNPNKNFPNDTIKAKYHFVNEFAFVPKDTTQLTTRKFDSANIPKNIQLQEEVDKEKARYGHPSSYFLSFTPEFVDLQLDNNFMESPYMTYDYNGPIYPFFNITNLMFKVGLSDMFKDYRIVGGFRIKGNLAGAEYLVSLENVKRRLDKKIIFYRKGETFDDNFTRIKQLNYELRFQTKYPFSEYSALKFEMFGREDRKITMTSEKKTLYVPDVVKYWIGAKTEYVFDNSTTLGINLYQGTRFKMYFEYFRNYYDKNDQFNVIGADYRKYIKIHKQIIWANRLAFASSFGNSKIVYFMGGEDNWLFPSFNNQIQVDPEINYVYKSVATNMRGFQQNIRNGNSYAVINSELRIPVIRYFYNRPLKSAFFENFQLLAFADVGTAWTGSDPYSKDNSLNKHIIYNGPLKITVISVGEPIVSGIGLGVRTTLLGYFIKVDKSWGYEAGRNIGNYTYISLGLDF
jgi:hypothetical protein